MRLRFLVFLSLLAVNSLAADDVAWTETGDQIPFMTYGDGSPTLVLIHGWTNNRTFWEPHIPGLSANNQVVTLDLASFGESVHKRTDWSMQAFALDVDAVLNELGINNAILIGFSMGGSVALELASLGRQNVKGVVLVDIHKDPEWRPNDAEMEAAVGYEREMWGNRERIASAIGEDASNTLVQRYLSRTPESAPDEWWESLRQYFHWSREEFSDSVAKIDVPIAAINTAQGATNVDAWNRIAPGFQVYVIDDVGHLGIIWEKIEEFDRALLDFVDRFEE